MRPYLLHQLAVHSFNFKMIFTTTLVSLLLTVAIVEGSECVPPKDDSEYGLESNTTDALAAYDEISTEAESAIIEGAGTIITGMEGGDECSTTGSDSDTAPVSRAILPWVQNCEPCPPTVYYLHRFLNYCYVIQKPFRQWIRFVSCPFLCNQPCWCYNCRCVKTRYKLVWVWAFCTQNAGFGFKHGLNFRWLWLPQDCQCREYYKTG